MSIASRRWNRVVSFALILLALALFGASPARSAPVVLLGDSWGFLIGPAVRSTLDANGHSSVALHNGSVPGSRAVQWNTDVFGTAATILAPHTDLQMIHLIVGGNDLLAGTGDPLVTIGAAVGNAVGFLGKLAAASSVPILFTGYEYLPNPPAGTTTELANQFLNAFVDGVASAVGGNPLLASRVTVLNTHGLMQVHFGVPQLGIAPFDPSLPDPLLPGPTTAFADAIHLNPAGYSVLAGHLYQQFYEPVLVPEPGVALLVVVGLATTALIRSRANRG